MKISVWALQNHNLSDNCSLQFSLAHGDESDVCLSLQAFARKHDYWFTACIHVVSRDRVWSTAVSQAL